MTRAISTSLPLPLELVTHIFNICAEYDIADDPNDRYEYFLAYKNTDDRYEEHQVSWTNAPASVKQDICNVRLVCKQFRSASSESFDTMLGDRRFRLTETGIQDLLDISKVNRAGTLDQNVDIWHGSTISTWSRNVFLPALCRRISRDCRTSRSAPVSVVRISGPSTVRGLQERFSPSSSCKSARIVVFDKAECLGGWLTPELRRSVDIYRNISSMWQPGPYASRTKLVGEVIEAFTQAGLILNDLRFSLQTSPLHCPLPASLHTLRITVSKDFFTCDSPGPGSPSFLMIALEGMTGLEELAIYVDTPWYRTAYYGETMTRGLVNALEKATNLRDVAFEGSWMFTETCLIAFVERHASSLCHLTLYNCVVRRDRVRVLRAIADLTRGHLEHRSVIYPLSAEVGFPIMSEDFSSATVSEWPRFSCATHIGPHVELRYELDLLDDVPMTTDTEDSGSGADEDGVEEDDENDKGVEGKI